MQILTEKNVAQNAGSHPDSNDFLVIQYEDGHISHIPKGFFRNNHDQDISGEAFGTFYIGRDSAIGVGSVAKYDGNNQSLVIGRHVRIGQRVKFVLNAQHETRTMAMSMFSFLMPVPPPPQYGNTVLGNDIWVGDEVMILGGASIDNGCVLGARTLVPPTFKTEPYGVYVGAPARLVRFRFSERVCEALSELAWWDMPFEWIKANNSGFLVDFTEDEARSLEVIAGLAESKSAYLAAAAGGSAE